MDTTVHRMSGTNDHLGPIMTDTVSAAETPLRNHVATRPNMGVYSKPEAEISIDGTRAAAWRYSHVTNPAHCAAQPRSNDNLHECYILRKTLECCRSRVAANICLQISVTTPSSPARPMALLRASTMMPAVIVTAFKAKLRLPRPCCDSDLSFVL